MQERAKEVVDALVMGLHLNGDDVPAGATVTGVAVMHWERATENGSHTRIICDGETSPVVMALMLADALGSVTGLDIMRVVRENVSQAEIVARAAAASEVVQTH